MSPPVGISAKSLAKSWNRIRRGSYLMLSRTIARWMLDPTLPPRCWKLLLLPNTWFSHDPNNIPCYCSTVFLSIWTASRRNWLWLNQTPSQACHYLALKLGYGVGAAIGMKLLKQSPRSDGRKSVFVFYTSHLIKFSFPKLNIKAPWQGSVATSHRGGSCTWLLAKVACFSLILC